MGSTYADTGLDLSERHLAWYVTQPVPEIVSPSQVGKVLYMYNTDAGSNHVFDFGGREHCAATLFAQGIGPMPEQDYPCRGAEGRLALDDLLANREAYINQLVVEYKETYQGYSDAALLSMAESAYESRVARYQKNDAYSPLDDWSINEPDEPGLGRLRGAPYTLTDNNSFNYCARLYKNDEGVLEINPEEGFNREPLYEHPDGYYLYQEGIDLIKSEVYAGHGVSTGLSITANGLNTENYSLFTPSLVTNIDHAACIVGWDDDYPASNFTHTKSTHGESLDAASTTPPGNGAWIVKNSWGSETDCVPGGLTAADSTPKDAHGGNWGVLNEQGKHTGYFYLSYYDRTITTPESFAFRMEANNDQQNALQHDYLPASVTDWSMSEKRPMWEANIFTVSKSMRIDEVATCVHMADQAPATDFTCTFDPYKLRESATKPDDGVHLATCTREFKNQGYHRVALDAPVYLHAGDRLGIAVSNPPPTIRHNHVFSHEGCVGLNRPGNALLATSKQSPHHRRRTVGAHERPVMNLHRFARAQILARYHVSPLVHRLHAHTIAHLGTRALASCKQPAVQPLARKGGKGHSGGKLAIEAPSSYARRMHKPEFVQGSLSKNDFNLAQSPRSKRTTTELVFFARIAQLQQKHLTSRLTQQPSKRAARSSRAHNEKLHVAHGSCSFVHRSVFYKGYP